MALNVNAFSWSIIFEGKINDSAEKNNNKCSISKSAYLMHLFHIIIYNNQKCHLPVLSCNRTLILQDLLSECKFTNYMPFWENINEWSEAASKSIKNNGIVAFWNLNNKGKKLYFQNSVLQSSSEFNDLWLKA